LDLISFTLAGNSAGKFPGCLGFALKSQRFLMHLRRMKSCVLLVENAKNPSNLQVKMLFSPELSYFHKPWVVGSSPIIATAVLSTKSLVIRKFSEGKRGIFLDR
jgi:hypothetical protein